MADSLTRTATDRINHLSEMARLTNLYSEFGMVTINLVAMVLSLFYHSSDFIRHASRFLSISIGNESDPDAEK